MARTKKKPSTAIFGKRAQQRLIGMKAIDPKAGFGEWLKRTVIFEREIGNMRAKNCGLSYVASPGGCSF